MGIIAEMKKLFAVTSKVAAGNIKEIRDAVTLANAITIFETNNAEMEKRYKKLVIAQANAETKLAALKEASTVGENASKLEATRAKIFASGLTSLESTVERLKNARNVMREKIKEHKVNIELLKAKLTLLEALKTINDSTIGLTDGDTNDNIMELVNQAIAAEDAIAQVQADLDVK